MVKKSIESWQLTILEIGVELQNVVDQGKHDPSNMQASCANKHTGNGQRQSMCFICVLPNELKLAADDSHIEQHEYNTSNLKITQNKVKAFWHG